MKTCTVCNEAKPLDAFYRHPKGRDGRTSVCRPCRGKQWHNRSPEEKAKRRARTRAHNRRKNGWTDELVDQRLAEQMYACGICGVDLTGLDNFHADHDHLTGKPRGLLCAFCNHGLGRFRDSIPSLEAAVRYLEYYNKEPTP